MEGTETKHRPQIKVEKSDDEKTSKKPKKPWYKRWWVWAVIAISLIAVGSSSDTTENLIVTEIEIIPCEKLREDDESLPLGEKEIHQKCIDGEKEVTYQITRVNGEEKSRIIANETTTKEAQPEITKVGTYEEPEVEEESEPIPDPAPIAQASPTPSASAPPQASATPSPSPPTQPTAPAYVKYEKCEYLNAVYPHGVGKSGAIDKGGSVTNFHVDDAYYDFLPKTLDRDKDGIMCERL